ncbi:MAG TPA: hypothetical protein VFR15_14660, partial [Chloroflexia bacterium]|nr:hypothetical protein [Chloroflexia bacterium]
MTKTAITQRLAWLATALSLAMVVAGFAISLLAIGDGDGEWLPTHLLFNPVVVAAFSFIGALVTSSQPRNPIGWILSTVGLLTGLTFFAYSYLLVSESLGPGNSLPGADIARWLDLWIWIPATLLPVTILLLLFPNGRLLSSRWRPVAWAAGLGIA